MLLEAGMALGHQPSRTIFVEIGHLRPVSDLTGRNVIRLNGTAEPLNALAGRLEAAGCQVNRANSRYLDGARFSDLSALDRGSQYVATTDARNVASLRVRLRHQGASGYLFEVRNEGSSVLEDVHWILPESASNWRLSTNMLTDYPIRAMQPEEVISVPVMISTGGPSMVIAELVARTSNGDSLNLRKRLSVFDSNGLEWR